MNDSVTKDKLVADFKVVVADAEELLRATAGQAGDKAAELRGRLQEHLARAKDSLADAQAAVVDKAKQVGHATDDYVRGVHAGRETRNTPADHIRKFYSAWSDIRDRTFDGLIVSGVNALKPRVTEEDIWPEVQRILAWSTTNVLSSLFLCWGAKAALKHFHDIDSFPAASKLFGLFAHRVVSDRTGILFGFPDVFPVPVSRWKSPRREDVERCAALEVVADSEEAGPNILAEAAPCDDGRSLFPRRLYILNHPEYDTETLQVEYRRDSAKDPATPLPRHYFTQGDTAVTPPNTWRHTAHIYTNWVKAVY